MLTMAPLPWASMCGTTWLQLRNTLLRLWSICASQTSSLISTGPPLAEPPTLLTSTSMRPNAAMQRATASAMASPRVTSQLRPMKRPPAATTRRSVSAMRSRSRSRPKMLAPSSAKRTAMARPLPQPGPTEPAPVTKAILPARRPLEGVEVWLIGSVFEAVEILRIEHQQLLAPRRIGRNARKRIDEGPVVRHMAVVGVRPVRAPEAALGVALQQQARQGHALGISRGRSRTRVDTVDAAELHMEKRIRQQSMQGREVGVLCTQRGIDPAHVVNHHGHGAARQHGPQAVDQTAFEVHLKVQAYGLEARRQRH